MSTKTWAIVLCHATDNPPDTDSMRRWSGFLSHYPVDPTGAFAYWADMLGGRGDLQRSNVFGWYDIGLTMAQMAGMSRQDTFNAGRNAVPLDLSQFAHVVVALNGGGGSPGNLGIGGGGVLFSWTDDGGFDPTFAFHEMGHELGLAHSFGEGATPCASGDGRPGVYCDPWDIMSALNCFRFVDRYGRLSGPGLVAPNLDRLGCVSPVRIWSPPSGWFIWSLNLGAPSAPGSGDYSFATFVAPSMNSAPSDFTNYSKYYVEYRHPSGWDAGLPREAVLIHEVRFADGLVRLIDSVNGGELQVGQPFLPPGGPVAVTLTSFNGVATTPTLETSRAVKIVSRSSGKVLDVPPGQSGSGSPIQQWSNDDRRATQEWLIQFRHRPPAADYLIVSRANPGGAGQSVQVLDVRGGPGAVADGVPIQTWDATGATNQLWALRMDGADAAGAYFTIISQSSGKVLSVAGGSAATGDGIAIQQDTDTGDTSQQWYLKGVDVKNMTVTPSATVELSGTVLCKILSRSSRKVLDVNGGPGATGDGVPIQQWADVGGTNQHWLLVPASGYYKVVSRSSNKVLDVTGGPTATTDGIPIQQWSDNGGTNQLWDLRPAGIDGTGTSFFKFIARSSGKVLDVTGGPGATADGIRIQQWDDLGQPNQHWYLIPVTTVFKVVSVSSGKVLDVTGGSGATADGIPIQQWSDNGGANQHWLITPTGDGYFMIVSESSGKVLDVTGGPGATGDGVQIQQWSANGGTNQHWQIQPVGGGIFTIVSRSSGRVLDVTGGPPATADGIRIQQWKYTGADNQHWRLVSIDD